MVLVIKYFEKFALTVPGVPDAYPAWAAITVRTGKNGAYMRFKRIGRAEAMKLIEENDLVEAFHKAKVGTVYDTPDGAFKKKYGKMAVPYNLGAE